MFGRGAGPGFGSAANERSQAASARRTKNNLTTFRMSGVFGGCEREVQPHGCGGYGVFNARSSSRRAPRESGDKSFQRACAGREFIRLHAELLQHAHVQVREWRVVHRVE